MIYVKRSIVKLHLFTSMQITDQLIKKYPRIHLIALSLHVYMYNLE